MSKILKTNVVLDGKTYVAGSTPPDSVAALITNPLAWGEEASKHSDPKLQQAVTKAKETARANKLTDLGSRLEGKTAVQVAAMVADDDTEEFANAVLEWDMANSKTGKARKVVAFAVADVIG